MKLCLHLATVKLMYSTSCREIRNNACKQTSTFVVVHLVVVGVGVNTTIIAIIKLLPLVNPYFLGNLEETQGNSGNLRET